MFTMREIKNFLSFFVRFNFHKSVDLMLSARGKLGEVSGWCAIKKGGIV